MKAAILVTVARASGRGSIAGGLRPSWLIVAEVALIEAVPVVASGLQVLAYPASRVGAAYAIRFEVSEGCVVAVDHRVLVVRVCPLLYL
jgi:hypothetical protein